METIIFNIKNIVKEEGICKIIFDYKKRLEWVELIKEHTLDNKVNWAELSKLQLEEEFIHEFRNDLLWLYISIYQDLTEKFMEEHVKYILWKQISKYQRLSEGFMKKYKRNLDWTLLSTYQRLTARFIDRHRDYVNWLKIANHQKGLPSGFLARHNGDIRRDIDIMYDHPREPITRI